MHKIFHGFLLCLVVMGMTCRIHQHVIIIFKIYKGLSHFLRGINNSEWHFQDICISTQLFRRCDPVSVSSKERYLFPLIHTEFGSDLRYGSGFPPTCGTDKKEDLGSLLCRGDLTWLSEFQDHLLINISQGIIKRHARFVHFFHLINDLIGILFIHFIFQHSIIKKLHEPFQFSLFFILCRLFFSLLLLLRLLKLLFQEDMKIVQFFFNRTVLGSDRLLRSDGIHQGAFHFLLRLLLFNRSRNALLALFLQSHCDLCKLRL